MKKISRFLAMVLVMSASFTSYAATDPAVCAENLKLGAPSAPNKNNIQVCRKGYALIFNTSTKTPIWVAEHLTKEAVYGAGVRSPQFSPDPEIPSQYQAKKSDYARSGYDQGHMAPAADFSQDQTLMNESFYFSNVVPQDADNNRHIWAGLEKKVRTWLEKRNELYIVTGPVFKNGRISNVLGASQVAVPDYIFKVVYDPRTENSIAFMVPNTPLEAKDLPNYIVSVRDVEMATGLNFHSLLPPALQEKFETRRAGMWTR